MGVSRHAPSTLLRRNICRYPLHRTLGGPQSQSGCLGEEKNCLFLPGIDARILQHIVPFLYPFLFIFKIERTVTFQFSVLLKKSE